MPAICAICGIEIPALTICARKRTPPRPISACSTMLGRWVSLAWKYQWAQLEVLLQVHVLCSACLAWPGTF